MYSSLQKVDIVVTEEDRRIGVQTDHREAAEIEAEVELSVVFAVTRALNPLRGAGCDGVRFVFAHAPPERLQQVCAGAGAAVEVTPAGHTVAAGPRDDARLAELVDEAMRALGSRLVDEHRASMDPEGIEKLCTVYAARAAAAGSVEENEIEYWTAVVELAAGVGEILCRAFGKRWGLDPDFYSLVPLVLVDDQGSGLTNVVDKVQRFFEHGPSESPVGLYRILTDTRAAADGPVMFNLRPPDWMGRDVALVLPPILQGVDGGELPIVGLVRDMPSSVANLPATTPDEEVASLRAEAERNLATIEVQVQEVHGPPSVLVVHGGYYASEKLLDPAFLSSMGQRLGTEMLLAAVPAKGELWLTSALVQPELVAAFAAVIENRYRDAPPNQRLSRALIVASEGRPVGIARLDGGPGDGAGKPKEEEERPKRGFWARLFGVRNE